MNQSYTWRDHGFTCFASAMTAFFHPLYLPPDARHCTMFPKTSSISVLAMGPPNYDLSFVIFGGGVRARVRYALYVSTCMLALAIRPIP